MALTRSKCIPNWKKCEFCQAILNQNNLDVHIAHHCPPVTTEKDWSYGHIYGKRLFTFLKTFEPQNKKELFFDDVIQISLAAAQLCDFPIGDPVVISTKDGQCIVKPMWPVEDNVLSSVFLTKQSLSELNCFEGTVEIKKMEKPPIPAKVVYLKCIKPEAITERQIAEISFMLNATFNNRIIVKGQHLIFSFYGLKPKFKVINVDVHQEHEDILGNLNDEFADITIHTDREEKLFKILSNTKWKIDILQDDKDKSCFENYCLSMLGGIDKIINDLKDVMYSILTSNHDKGQNNSCGVIIHGISGTGKTYLAKAIINIMKLPVIQICSWQIFSKYFGEAENRIKAFFEEAIEKAPSIVLIDELDTFCPGKSSSDQEKRVLAVLLSMLDKLNNFKVIVLGITRQLDLIDSALRRPGRFDYEVEIPVPDANARIEILERLLQSYHHEVSRKLITHLGTTASHGYVGSDLSLACTLANTRAINSAKKKLLEGDGYVITEDHLMWAFTQVKPSAMREILVEVPNVKWSDVGGQEDLKLKLQQVLEWPLKYPDSFTRLGITPPRGILLFGPPGCSKTMVARAVATESKLNFISVKGAELFSKWVGESEKAVREVFRRARIVSPSVIFFDEIDAISAERETDNASGSSVQDRVLSQLLTEMDGIKPLNNVTIIAATNRPDRIDSALLRPGRLDRKLYVPLPDSNTRRAIFTLQMKKTPIAANVDVEWLIECTEGYSGAEVVAVCHEAAMKTLQDNISAERVYNEHFEYALTVVKPRTPKSLLEIYDKFLENK